MVVSDDVVYDDELYSNLGEWERERGRFDHDSVVRKKIGKM